MCASQKIKTIHRKDFCVTNPLLSQMSQPQLICGKVKRESSKIAQENCATLYLPPDSLSKENIEKLKNVYSLHLPLLVSYENVSAMCGVLAAARG